MSIRASIVPAKVRLLESAFVSPSRYVRVEIFLFEKGCVLWEDEETKGTEVILRGSLDVEIIRKSNFPVTVVLGSLSFILDHHRAGDAAGFSLFSDRLVLFAPLPELEGSDEVAAAIESNSKAVCSIDYVTNGSRRGRVELVVHNSECGRLFSYYVKRVDEIKGVSLLLAPGGQSDQQQQQPDEWPDADLTEQQQPDEWLSDYLEQQPDEWLARHLGQRPDEWPDADLMELCPSEPTPQSSDD